ncbi:MAG: T9SS type A sorting domain-containing protein, partial [Bacteroidota bacterium]
MRLFTPAAALAALLFLAAGAQAQNLRAPALYPNPITANGVLTVEVADAESARAEVLDVLGRRVSLDGPLAAGTYLVRAVYADGRATAPSRFTTVTTTRVEVRLAEAGAPLAPEAETVATPVAEASLGGGCAPGNVTFGGFQHTVLTDGSLRVRADLQPKSLRAQPSKDFATVDFSTCFGAAKGYAFRYVDQASQGNRSLRVLPTVAGESTR